jgi:hypothetical protein
MRPLHIFGLHSENSYAELSFDYQRKAMPPRTVR